ncbi:MAG: valine--tRNA ligase, partial [Planctomycetes bacterium]|nr:valine--tRNA ligase [Planctomycetota bacterium]
HMGHALNNTLQDVLIRFRRMQGDNTLWLPGTDHAGIATQSVVEQQILKEHGNNRHQIGRDALLENIRAWKEQYGTRILDQLKRLGASCDWRRTRFTLDDVCAQAVRHTFVNLFRQGLIYRGKRLVNWDPVTQTALADDEVDHKEIQGHFWYIRYPVVDSAEFITIATTRPETMLGDTAVAVNPKDERAAQFLGKMVQLPLTDRQIPIIADDYVKRGEGTGFLKVTPAHDPNDYEIGLRHNLDQINILNPDASINENGGKYQNLDRFQARKQIVADLEAQGLIEKIEDHLHQVGHSYRSHALIEPYLSDQWYVKVRPLAEPAIEAVTSGRIRFHPSRYTDTYLDWLKGVRDWCISRQLWWGHRIPIWYCQSCSQISTGVEDPIQCEHCNSTEIQQDPDVLDTWFSSALWPHSTLGWPNSNPDLNFYYPTDVLVTSRDIITLWVSRMVMMGLFNMNDIPFTDVFIHGKILDGKGITMSKSKGNGIDPIEIIDTYGADAMRFSLTQMTTESQDMRMPVTKDKDGRNISEKFDIGRNFCNKLWNASRFALGNLENYSPPEKINPDQLLLEDRWILSRLAQTVQTTTNQLYDFKFSEPINALYKFFWNDLCDWYLEIIKPRMRNDQQRPLAQQVLATVLDVTLRLFHPFLPFISEQIFQQLNTISRRRSLPGLIDLPPNDYLITATWPANLKHLNDQTAETHMTLLQDTIRPVRDIRTRYQIAPRQLLKVDIKTNQDNCDIITHQQHILCDLANLEELHAAPQCPKPPDAAVALAEDMEIYVHNVIDRQAEQDRLQKKKQEINDALQRTQAKLDNQNFVTRAKPDVVQRERDRLSQLQEQLATIEKNLAAVM